MAAEQGIESLQCKVTNCALTDVRRIRLVSRRKGAKILFDDGAPVRENGILLEWDPYTFSILTEVTGTVHFKDLSDGVRMQERVDEITGMSQWMVTESPDEKRVPQVIVRDAFR